MLVINICTSFLLSDRFPKRVVRLYNQDIPSSEELYTDINIAKNVLLYSMYDQTPISRLHAISTLEQSYDRNLLLENNTSLFDGYWGVSYIENKYKKKDFLAMITQIISMFSELFPKPQSFLSCSWE